MFVLKCRRLWSSNVDLQAERSTVKSSTNNLRSFSNKKLWQVAIVLVTGIVLCTFVLPCFKGENNCLMVQIALAKFFIDALGPSIYLALSLRNIVSHTVAKMPLSY